MNLMSNRIKPVVQNVILGSVTGVMVGINLRTLFLRVGGTDIVWPLFFILGPAIGYFSGKERERFEKLKKEKQDLEENLNKIHTDLKNSKQIVFYFFRLFNKYFLSLSFLRFLLRFRTC